MLSGATSFSALPLSIQRALAIDPALGSTYLDAEHVVLLMQENRSFDHAYGTLQGVRGFNDPRAIRLPNNNLVWLQTNEAGETYLPFRLDIKQTKITWMGSLPHTWTDQVDARNNGKYDRWLHVKKPWEDAYAHMPLTMGYYTREDIPFYYALADAFTICDQHFCSSLTGTTPNRLHFWTGTIREEQNENSKANVWNGDADHYTMVSWRTFPERLEENGISWKIYQNDIGAPGIYSDDEDVWLSNFGDNPIEYFAQYNVKLSQRYIDYLQKAVTTLPGEINELKSKLESATGDDAEQLKKNIDDNKATLSRVEEERKVFSREKYEQLSPHEKALHEKAFTSNKTAPFFYELESLQYEDGGVQREVQVPKGDIFYQFRKDVKTGNLPTVSWLVAPENFSDHPSAAWFGAWYISEALDILTQNPEVWKKTIFIVTYDENDGYFDHVPPFVAPNLHKQDTGKTSGIDTSVDFVTIDQERRKKDTPEEDMRESSIGLGYRVPLLVVSPWTRGGFVCSQVFDLTSSLQFLEKFLSHKTGKKIEEPNISTWRRAVCGDLRSVFRQYNGEKITAPDFIDRDPFIESIHKAKFKKEPADYRVLSDNEIAEVNHNAHLSALIPAQEKGTRPSTRLPYELYVDSKSDTNKKSLQIVFTSGKKIFGASAAGSPFVVYNRRKYLGDVMREWSYAVSAGSTITDEWMIENFDGGIYHFSVYGPNGFYREFKGDMHDPSIDVICAYEQSGEKLSGNVQFLFANNSKEKTDVEIVDNSYKTGTRTLVVDASSTKSIVLDLNKNSNWYDFSVKVKGNDTFEKRYAGHVEVGKESRTDPLMGRVIG